MAEPRREERDRRRERGYLYELGEDRTETKMAIPPPGHGWSWRLDP